MVTAFGVTDPGPVRPNNEDHLVGGEQLRRNLAKRRLGSARGQTTTEWLMIAGILTAIVLFFNSIMPGALRAFVRGLAWGIRTVAP